jgi:hypothetical protein
MKTTITLFALLLFPCFVFANDPKQENLSSLTTDEIKIFQYGEISTGSLIGGGLLGTFIGFGTGHIVYGKYTSRGWMFTLGEFAALGIAAAGASKSVIDCTLSNANGCSNGFGLFIFGAVSFYALRIFEIIDVWTLPGVHNREFRAIQEKAKGSIGFRILPNVEFRSNNEIRTHLNLSLSF